MSSANISAMLAEDRRHSLDVAARRARMARTPDSRRRRSSLIGRLMRLVERPPQVTVARVVDSECALLPDVF